MSMQTTYRFSDSHRMQKKALKNISGYILMISDGPFSWKSKQQTFVAQRSQEEEYIALFAVGEALWFRKFKHVFSLDATSFPTFIKAHNQGYITLVKTDKLMIEQNM